MIIAAPDALLAAAKAGAAGGEADGAGDGGKIVALQSEITSLTSQLNTVSEAVAKDAATVFVDAELTYAPETGLSPAQITTAGDLSVDAQDAQGALSV